MDIKKRVLVTFDDEHVKSIEWYMSFCGCSFNEAIRQIVWRYGRERVLSHGSVPIGIGIGDFDIGEVSNVN